MLRRLLFLPFVCGCIHTYAQQTSWKDVLKPKLASTNELVLRAGDGYHDVVPSTHSDLSATFKYGEKLEFFVEYDLVKKQLCGGKLTWHPARQLALYAGIIKNPYINELGISPRNIEAVGYSMAASYLGGYGSDLSGISSRGRDIGIMADLRLLPRQKGYDLLRLQIGVFNGNGFSFRDDNHYKDLSGRIDVKPSQTLTFAFGGMYGRYSINDGRGIAYNTTDQCSEYADRMRMSASVWYDDKTCFVRAEGVYGKTDGLRSCNVSCLAGWWMTRHISPSVRYETFCKDLDDCTTRKHNIAICGTYKWNSNMNVRLQYNHQWYADGQSADNYFAIGLNIRLTNENKEL